MKKTILVILSAIMLLLISGCSSSNIVDVSNNDSEIKKGTETFIKNIYHKKMTIELKNSANIGKNKIVTFTTNDKELKSGSASLEEISDNKYRFQGVTFMNYPNSPLVYPSYMTVNEKPYVVAIFRKYNNLPKQFKCKIGQDNVYSKEITFDVPNSDYGIQIIELDQSFSGENIGTSEYRFYDEKNIEITDKIKLEE